jgi:hypothetical protein
MRKTRGSPASELEGDACGSRKAQQRWGRAACRSLCLRGWLCRADSIPPERLALSRRCRKPCSVQQNEAAVTRLRLQVQALSKLSGGNRGLTPSMATLPRGTSLLCVRSGASISRTSLSCGLYNIHMLIDTTLLRPSHRCSRATPQKDATQTAIIIRFKIRKWQRCDWNRNMLPYRSRRGIHSPSNPRGGKGGEALLEWLDRLVPYPMGLGSNPLWGNTGEAIGGARP